MRHAAVLALLAWGGSGAVGAQLPDSLRPSIGATGIQGFAMPSYDRVSGLAFPMGVDVAVPTLWFRATPLLTYRSQLGTIDPSVDGAFAPNDRSSIAFSASRGVFSNDAWIRNDLINSAEFLFFGEDSRNYFRGTRGEARASHAWRGAGWQIRPSLGARFERTESVRAGSFLLGGPFTFFNKTDSLNRVRRNALVQGGAMQSALLGLETDWDSATITTHLRLDAELARQSSTADGSPIRDPRFAQFTLDGSISFPTFDGQSFRLHAHAVMTTGGDTPRQRWVYFGGPGTMPTLDMLSLGGDRLVFLDAHYAIPIRRHPIPVLGVPLLELREAVGGAAFHRFPALEQMSGLRLAAGYLYTELLVDPIRRRSSFSAGISVFQ